ncbi:MAG: DUF3570 domain-containing protein, partial [Syntrophales bacterium LBB04]|nr:DUF3570 domain-containing protein [Syntrophales bacterium LBB04]
VAYAFEARYKFIENNSSLISEIGFLKEIILLLENAKADRSGKMSAYTIGLVVDQYLQKAVVRLEAVRIEG